jgi:hypothetical protein
VSQARGAAEEIVRMMLEPEGTTRFTLIEYTEAIIEKHSSPLVIAADQLAEAVEFGKEHGYYDVRKLRTALANYKRLREG